MKRWMMATALTVAALTTPAGAQAPADHESHHPSGSSQTAPAAANPPPAANPPGMGAPQGGMGMPMMGMMNDMKGMMSSMSMMNTMAMMDSGMGGMATMDRVEGRIAFLRTELKITEAQTGAWNAFADTLRANAQKLGEVRASMMAKSGDAQQQASTMADRLELQERWLLARLEGTRAMKSAFTKLNETLSDDQKKTANDLLAPHMGLGLGAMAMMPAQMQPGQMQSGPMGPGRMQPGQKQRPRGEN